MNGLSQEHVGLVAKNQARYSIRGGTGLIFAIVTLMTGLIIGAILIDPISSLEKEGVGKAEISELADKVTTEIGRPVIKWATDASDAELDYWLTDNPGLVSAFLLIFAMFVPFLACLGAFNQLSGDIGSRGIRYLLLRTERINLFAGRFIGSYLFCLGVYLVLFLIMGLFFLLKIDFYDKGDVILWLLRGALVISIYTLPFIALSAWISCSIDSPFGSLSVALLLVGVTPLLLLVATKMYQPAGVLNYATPWFYRQWLFDPALTKVLAGVGIMISYTGLFLFLGARHFERRDL